MSDDFLQPPRIGIKDLYSQVSYLNEVDRYIINLARNDKDINHLDKGDFTESPPDWDSLYSFLGAVKRYVDDRLDNLADVKKIEERFLSDIGKINLPDKYRPAFMPKSSNTFFGGNLWGLGFYGLQRSDTQVGQLDESRWRLNEGGLALQYLVPREMLPNLYSGVMASVGATSGGALTLGDEELARVSNLNLSTSLMADYQLPVSPWMKFHFMPGIGFSVSRYQADITREGQKVIQSPCAFRISNIPTSLGSTSDIVDEAGESMACKLEESVGIYTSFPIHASAGVELWESVRLLFTYRYMRLHNSDDEMVPGVSNGFFLMIGGPIRS